MSRVAIALGSNLGDRLGYLRQGVAELEALGKLVGVSSLYETEPVGGPEQGRFLNAVVVIETELPPLDLLAALHEAEQRAGRVRDVRWGPRTLDLDLITYDQEVIDLPILQVPHPRAVERRFVLAPLVEVWPGAEVAPGLRAERALERLGGQRIRRWEGDWREETPHLGREASRWVAAQSLLILAFGAALLLWGSVPDTVWRWVPGLLLVGAGLALIGTAVPALGPELTPFPQPRPGGALVDRGPYRLIRHPIYAGILFTFTGLAVLAASWPAGVAVVILAGFFRLKSEVEERALAISVPGYPDYLARVPHRFLPFLW